MLENIYRRKLLVELLNRPDMRLQQIIQQGFHPIKELGLNQFLG